MADDYITTSHSEASCLCIVRAGYELFIFFPVKWKWSDHHAGQRSALCSTTFNNKATFIYYQKELMYLLLHILQLSHLLLDDQQKKKKKPFYTSSHWSIKLIGFFLRLSDPPTPRPQRGWLSIRQPRHTSPKGASRCIQILIVPSRVASASAASASSQQVTFYPVPSNSAINMGGDVSSQRRRACGGDAVASWLMQRLLSKH